MELVNINNICYFKKYLTSNCFLVNLKYGIPPDETSVTCTAGIGTFIIEFGTLSRLTGDPVYEVHFLIFFIF